LIILIDGLYESFRHADPLNQLVNSKGKHTGLVYGFLRALKVYIQQHLTIPLVIWDGDPICRKQKFPAYKANRKPFSTNFVTSITELQKLLSLLGVTQYRHPDWEADDVLASFATTLSKKGENVLIVSGDSDVQQLIRSKPGSINVYDPEHKRYLNYEYFKKLRKFEPEDLVLFKSIMGDSSDNIPGVKGIGEVKAQIIFNYIKKYDSVNTLKLIKEKDRIELKQAKKQTEDIQRNMDLIKLNTSLMTDPKLEEICAQPNWKELFDCFIDLEFKSFLKEIESWWKIFNFPKNLFYLPQASKVILRK